MNLNPQNVVAPMPILRSRGLDKPSGATAFRCEMSTKITQVELKELLNYDANTGVFTRRVSRRGYRAGSIAGSTNRKGYHQIGIGEIVYKAHRLAWLYVYGAWPANDVDHINGVRNDNRIENLRAVTRSENLQNQRNARGYTRNGGGWMAQIRFTGAQHYLGTFPTESEARDAYLTAKKTFHPSSPINNETRKGNGWTREVITKEAS